MSPRSVHGIDTAAQVTLRLSASQLCSARSTIRKARFAIRRPFVESLILSHFADNASPSYFFVIFDMLLKGRMLALAGGQFACNSAHHGRPA
jgi:hypothetical protein